MVETQCHTAHLSSQLSKGWKAEDDRPASPGVQDQPEEHTKIKKNHLNICRKIYMLMYICIGVYVGLYVHVNDTATRDSGIQTGVSEHPR